MRNIYPTTVFTAVLCIFWHVLQLVGAQRYGYDDDGQPLHFNEVHGRHLTFAAPSTLSFDDGLFVGGRFAPLRIGAIIQSNLCRWIQSILYWIFVLTAFGAKKTKRGCATNQGAAPTWTRFSRPAWRCPSTHFFLRQSQSRTMALPPSLLQTETTQSASPRPQSRTARRAGNPLRSSALPPAP